MLSHVKDSLLSEKVGTVESAKAFLDMLKTFRDSGKEAISEAMTGPDSTYIVYVIPAFHLSCKFPNNLHQLGTVPVTKKNTKAKRV